MSLRGLVVDKANDVVAAADLVGAGGVEGRGLGRGRRRRPMKKRDGDEDGDETE